MTEAIKGYKYWITPKGETINIALKDIDEHFKYFNDTEEGRKLKQEYRIETDITPANLYFVLHRGFIRVLELNDILNISYAGHSAGNQIPVSSKARDSLLSFLLKDTITEVQYDCFIGSKSISNILPKKEYVKLFEKIMNVDKEMIKKILNS